MADQKTNLFEVNTIGTVDNPVEVLYVKQIFGVTNLSYTPPLVQAADVTTTYGLAINSSTDKVTVINNIENAVTFDDTVTITGAATCSSTLQVGGNIRLNGNWVCNDGDNEGMKVGNTGVVTVTSLDSTGIINANRTGGHSLVADETVMAVQGYYFNTDQGITDTSQDIVNDIRWNGATLEYRKGTANTKGGIIINWTEGAVWIPVP